MTGDGLVALKRRLLGARRREPRRARRWRSGREDRPLRRHVRSRSTSATCGPRRTRGRRWGSTAWPSCPRRCRRTASAPVSRRRRPPRDGAPRHGRALLLRGVGRRAAAAGAELHRRHGRRPSLASGPRDSFVLVVGADTWPRWRPGASRSGCSSLVEVAVVDRPGYAGPEPRRPFPAPAACGASRDRRSPISATPIRERVAPRAERALPGARRGGRLHREAGALRVTLPRPGRAAPRGPPSTRRPRTWWRSTCARRPPSPTSSCSLSGQNQRQLVAIADAVLEALRAQGRRPHHVEGYPRQEWILLDYGELRRPRLHAAHARLLRPRAALGRGGAAGGRGVTTAARGARRASWPSRAAMRELVPLVLRLAETRSPVLLEGESGTGKDLVAHWLHYGGPRREGPFIKVHCPSIPEELLESELFGHEKGAFTDARQPRRARSRWRPGARSTSTRSRTCARRCRRSCCAWSRSGVSSAWAGRARSRWTCASWPRRTSTSRRRSRRAGSARTSSTA